MFQSQHAYYLLRRMLLHTILTVKQQKMQTTAKNKLKDIFFYAEVMPKQNLSKQNYFFSKNSPTHRYTSLQNI